MSAQYINASDFETVESGEGLTRLVFLVKIFSLLAFSTLFFFGLEETFVYRNFLLGPAELLLASTIALNALSLYFGASVLFVRNILILVVSVSLAVMQLTGGIQDTGIFWFYVMPTSVFFLSGRRGGVFWMGVVFLFSITIVFLQTYGVVDTPYSTVTVRQMLFSLLVASVMVYAYEKRVESENVGSRRKTKELMKLNEDLAQEIASRREAEKQLTSRTDELERTNRLLVGRELRMIELKKEIKKLKNTDAI